ncbi:hypothetical protein OQA88_6120 [Cercophora sp. LCS_1]
MELIQLLTTDAGGPYNLSGPQSASELWKEFANTDKPTNMVDLADMHASHTSAGWARLCYLPVTLDDNTGYYLWNIDDPNYWSILNSGAIWDLPSQILREQVITIKVPFHLLNLTLATHIVEKPVTYFPCHDAGTYDVGWWELGRAFLHAAFMGINFEKTLTFLAQAPGPDLDQSVMKLSKRK